MNNKKIDNTNSWIFILDSISKHILFLGILIYCLIVVDKFITLKVNEYNLRIEELTLSKTELLYNICGVKGGSYKNGIQCNEVESIYPIMPKEPNSSEVII